MDNFGARLKKILESKGITQQDLAVMAETTGATISRYVNDNRTPNADLLSKIATALGISTDYLLGVTGTKLSDKLAELRRKKGLSMREAAEALGIDIAHYSKYETAGHSPDYQSLNKLAALFQVSVDYLLGISNPAADHQHLLDAYEAEERVPIRKYDAVKAGFGGVTLDGLIGYEFFDKSSINGHLADDYFCVQIKGDSMAPQLIENDIVLVKKQEDVDSGQVAVVVVNDDEATVKKVKKGRDYVELIPNNPAYDSLFIEEDQMPGLHIVGLVVELKRKF